MYHWYGLTDNNIKSFISDLDWDGHHASILTKDPIHYLSYQTKENEYDKNTKISYLETIHRPFYVHISWQSNVKRTRLN